jgi:hypothetical protein
MYPEARYSPCGTLAYIPDSVGKLVKMNKVPLVIVETKGAFHYDPLYNGLQLRKVDVSADVTYVLSPEEIAQKSVDELNDIIKKYFSFLYQSVISWKNVIIVVNITKIIL